MNVEQRPNLVADRYRAQGYRVVVRPRPKELPDVATDFNVEIIARRDDAGALASAKKSQADLEADRELPKNSAVQSLVETARMLLDESRAARKTA